jgi:hypothetical protein
MLVGSVVMCLIVFGMYLAHFGQGTGYLVFVSFQGKSNKSKITVYNYSVGLYELFKHHKNHNVLDAHYA